MGTAVEDQDKDDLQRWTTKRKAALVLSIVKGETSIQEAARQHELTVARAVKLAIPGSSIRRICQVLEVSRSAPTKNQKAYGVLPAIRLSWNQSCSC